MMKKVVFYLSVLPLIFLSACFLDETDQINEFLENNITDIEQYLADNNIDAQQTESGLYYSITEENPEGQPIEVGQQISLHYVGKLLSGTAFDSSSVFLERPERILLDVGFLLSDDSFFPNPTRILPAGLSEGLSLLKTGEKAIFLMPNTLAFGGSSNSIIPPYSVLVYEVEIISSKTESVLIDEYLVENDLTVTQTGSGLRYTTIDPELGTELPDDDDIVTINYTGKLLDGFRFDSSVGFTYIVDDESGFVEGWKEAMKLFPVGYKGEIIFPSSLGYGANGQLGSGGQYDIPPYAPLIFEIEVTNIEKN